MSRAADSLARGPLAIAAALALALTILWALTAQGVTTFIVPPPEQVGQQFFTSLKGHNFEAARHLVSSSLQTAVSAEELRRATRHMEQANFAIEQANGEGSIEQENTAISIVTIKLDNGTVRTVRIPMMRENALWVITSLAPLEALVTSR